MRFVAILLLFALTEAVKYFADDFEDNEWAQRWKRSTIEDEDKPLGELKRTKGIWSAPLERSGLATATDASHFRIGAPFTQNYQWDGQKPLIVYYNYKQEVLTECGGGFLKFLGPEASLETLAKASPYILKFGPDFCGTSTRHVLFSIFVQGVEYKMANPVRAISSRRTHTYTLMLFPDLSFQIGLDDHTYPREKFHLRTSFPGLFQAHPEFSLPALGHVVFDVFQVKSGAMLDGLLVTDSVEELAAWTEAQFNVDMFAAEGQLLALVIAQEKMDHQRSQNDMLVAHEVKLKEDQRRMAELHAAEARKRAEAEEFRKNVQRQQDEEAAAAIARSAHERNAQRGDSIRVEM